MLSDRLSITPPTTYLIIHVLRKLIVFERVNCLYCVTLKIPVRQLSGPSIVSQIILNPPPPPNSPNFLQTFPEVLPNVLIFRQTFSVLSGSLEFSEMFRTPDCLVMAFDTKSKQKVAVFPKYSPSCGKIFAGLAICSPNNSQSVSNSPIDHHARQLVAKCLQNNLKTITFSSRNYCRLGVTARCEQLTTN